MRVKRLAVMAFPLVGLLLIPWFARAQSPDAILKMCLRDGRNTVRRLKRDVSSGASSFHSLVRTCIEGPKAEKIKNLAGYQEVLKLHKEAKSLLEGAVKQQEETKASAIKASLDLGPGGDKKAVMNRWRVRPGRCIEPAKWDKAAGNAPEKSKRTARIAGLDDEQDVKRINPRVFSGKGSAGRWPSGMTAWDHLVRIACGKAVEGIDSFYLPNRQVYGTQFLEGDSRTILARAISEGTDDEDHKVLYNAALIQEAFGGTAWNAKEDYEAFLYFSDAIGKPPSEAEVSAAIDKLFPERKYEKDNLLFVFSRGVKAMKEIGAAFDKMESKYPRMKAVYRDTALQARKRWNERRKRYAGAYRILDPITASLLEDPTSSPPAGCESKLLGLRAQLAREIKPKDEKGIRKLRIEHPLGYQITEALAYCYLGQGKFAKAKLEADALKRTNRRVNLGEEIFYSRRDAISALEQELGSAEKIRKFVPNYSTHGIGMPVPGSVRRSPRFYAAIDSKGDFLTRGGDDRKPAVVASRKKVATGVQLIFKKYTFTYKYRDVKCKATNKVDRYEYEFPPGGRTIMRPIYRQKCWKVGPVKKKRITYQEKPVIFPEADAKGIKKGMQLIVLDNRKVAGDAVIIDCWLQKGKKKALVSQGIAIH